MKVLLFSMPDSSPFVRAREWEIANLAISSLAGNLSARHEVQCADLVVRQWSVRRSVERALTRFRPDVVGLSSMTFQYHSAQHIARMVRRLVPHAITVLGGYHATFMAEDLVGEADDGAVRGALVRDVLERSVDKRLHHL